MLNEVKKDGYYENPKLGIAYKNEAKENSYIVEFKSVDLIKPLELTFQYNNTNLDKIKEVKAIKVK